MPQAAMSSLDPQVIDKRIEDLKTVEQWLGFNLNLVRSTIQGLEIQKGTLAAIQSFQQSMQDFGQTVSAKASEPGPDADKASPEQAASPNQTLNQAVNQAAMAQASDWWNGVQQQFQTFVQAAQQAAAGLTCIHCSEQCLEGPVTPAVRQPLQAAVEEERHHLWWHG
jgi:hypothetical protein